MHAGFDVSRFQGSPDFQKAADADFRFVYIKATEGQDFVDAGFKDRQAAARKAGLHTGFYHFLRPRDGRTGAVEADFFWKNVKGVDGGEDGAELLRLVADVEATGLSVAKTLVYAQQFLDRLGERAGHEPVLYTYPGFIADWGAAFADYRLWIANYTSAARPTLPRPWTDWTAWQWTDKGEVPGVDGRCDRNRCPVLSELILERNEY